MKITPIQMICPKDKWNIKCPYEMIAEGVVVHNTANDATARQEISYMNRNNNYCSFHYAIDDKEVVQGLPENRNNFSCGDGANGKGNRTQIAVEICHSKSGGKKFDDAEKLAAQFIAQLLKQHGWNIDKISKHQDYSGKYCPHRTLDLGWNRFLQKVKINLDALNHVPAQGERIHVGDSVKVIGKKYATGQTVPAWVKLNTYTVVQVVKNKALLEKINSWVYLDDLTVGKKNIAEGSKVKIKQGAKYGGAASGKAVPTYVINRGKYTVLEIKKHKGIDEARLGDINSWVPVKYLY